MRGNAKAWEERIVLPQETTGAPPQIRISRNHGGAVVVQLLGDWRLGDPVPSEQEVGRKILQATGKGIVAFDSRELGHWDSCLISFCQKAGGLFCR